MFKKFFLSLYYCLRGKMDAKRLHHMFILQLYSKLLSLYMSLPRPSFSSQLPWLGSWNWLIESLTVVQPLFLSLLCSVSDPVLMGKGLIMMMSDILSLYQLSFYMIVRADNITNPFSGVWFPCYISFWWEICTSKSSSFVFMVTFIWLGILMLVK